MLKKIIPLFLLVASSVYADKSNEDAFTRIYDEKLWGENENGEGTSGTGSTVASTVEYRALVQKFMKDHRIKSVVDIGCGDWEFSRLMNWDGIDYTGLDVVKSVINKNKQKYAKSNIRFIHADISKYNLPKGDLLLCKDVLMHLPNKDVASVLRNFKKYMYCLVTNNISKNRNYKINRDIKRGGFRFVDVTRPPFNLKGKIIYTYQEGRGTKDVILIKR